MPRIAWDAVGEKYYETGVDRVSLYPVNAQGEYTPGVAWNGVTSISETPEGAEPNDQYADNIKYLSILSAEDLGGTIEAFQSPKEFDACDGAAEVAPGVVIGQQARKPFGLSYRTKIGNDTDGEDHGYKLHLLYGAKASPSERSYETINDSPEAATLSWDYTTTPVPVTGYKPTALITIRSTDVDASKLKALEDILYGTDATAGREGEDGTDARLPLPDEVITLLSGGTVESISEARRRNMVRTR